MHEKRIEIRWRDQDAADHVNNAVFLTYLEEVRDEWLDRTLGQGSAFFDYVLAHVEIDFRRELRLADDFVLAQCGLKKVGNASITTEERIMTPDGELAAEAIAVVVARDAATGETRQLTTEEKARLAADA